jgi:4-amino-4-deoxy-L-arabinose transferase-like glycosyltransferase
MISFRELSMSKLLRSWSWIPLALFLVLLLHASTLGLSDDEAYYWVLAQKLRAGFAFHPPAVIWSIGIFQVLFGWLFGAGSVMLVRLPACLYSAGILRLALSWIDEVTKNSADRKILRAALAILAVPGIFALSWMIVPDLPLLFGYMLAFVATWRLCSAGAPERKHLAMLVCGIALSILSKYSGALVVVSSGLAVLVSARREFRLKIFRAILIGSIIGLVPIIIWNATHGWASILYQIKDRHGGAGLSISRYAKFWGSQLLLAGPVTVAAFFMMIKRSRGPGFDQVLRYALIWAVPAALVFCLQPLVSDFKPHWALVAWLPVALWLGCEFSKGFGRWWTKLHLGYGLAVSVLVLLSCHVPIGTLVLGAFGRSFDPKLDVSNDLYGWSALKNDMLLTLNRNDISLPLVGSRYQTSSQAAFALADVDRVSFIPRDAKQMDEWPDLKVAEGQGPGWPKLTRPVLFVADNRYDAGPAFAGARCGRLQRYSASRFGYLAKRIDLWRCEPVGE